MCNIGKAIGRAFGIKDSPDPAAANALTAAQNSANLALLAQKQAQDQATAAADSQSEGNRLASEQRMRKLLAAGPFGAATSTDYGAAPVATRQLYGA